MQKDDSTDSEDNSTTTTTNERLCVALLKSGRRKGKACGSKAAYDDYTHCKKHAKEKVLCAVILQSGANKGKPCLREGKYPGGVCGNHYSAEKKKSVQKDKDDDDDDDDETSVGQGTARCLGVVELHDKVYVLGVNGSSIDTGAWRAFWERHTKLEYPKTCRAKECEKTATCTGHMYLRDDAVKRYNYLIPICSHHNGKQYDTKAFLLKQTTVAVKIRENPSVKK